MAKAKRFPIPPKDKRRRKPDPHYPAAVERAKDAARRLQEAGIVDSQGRRIRKDLPADTARRKLNVLIASFVGRF